MLRRRLTGLLLTLLALAAPIAAFGEASTPAPAVQVRETKLEIGENAVCYPQLEGMTDESVQQRINDDIVASGGITAHILTLSTLGQSAWGLQVDYEAYLDEQVFSVVLHALGKQPEGRNGQSNVALSYDLATGGRLTLGDLFQDESRAVEQMEALAQEALQGEISEYMDNAQLTPLPVNSFYLDGDGITFYYPASQLSYVSGYAGACQFYYEELAGLLDEQEGGLPARMGVLPRKMSENEAAQQIRQLVESGRLPHVPAVLGQSMTELVETYRLVRTPDAFPGGRYFVLEAPQFRGVLLISDSMESGYGHSVLEGIQLKRGSLCGLKTGAAERSQWRKILGEPQETIQFSESMAFDYGLQAGQSDVYRFGEYELRLHADQSGVLECIQVSK